jgi:hypothetical protein
MKFKTCVENAREELIKALEFVKGIKRENQTKVVGMFNTALHDIDSLLFTLDQPNAKLKPNLKPRHLPDDDPSAKQMREIWEHMNTPDAGEYKLMVLRLEPQMTKGVKINGYLQTHHLPTTIPDVIEKTGQQYGGGKFQIRIVDGAGKYVKSKTFEISGLPKISDGKIEVEKIEKDAEVLTANDPATKKPARTP